MEYGKNVQCFQQCKVNGAMSWVYYKLYIHCVVGPVAFITKYVNLYKGFSNFVFVLAV